MSNLTDKATYSIQGFQDLLEDILAWWVQETIDDDFGGFIGRIGGDGRKYRDAEKGVVLNTRILWTFSRAVNTGFKTFTPIADRAYQYIFRYFSDEVYGGLYWMLDHKGVPVNSRKQIYAQAFGIYAYTEYHKATGSVEALNKARNLYALLEDKAWDKENSGYLEAFSENWSPLSDMRLSSRDANEAKTMNTHLHLLEAYTNLYKADPSVPVKFALSRMIELYCDKFIDTDSGRLKLFFDEDWNEKISHDSFGHEIETAWLLNEAAEAIGDFSLISRVKRYSYILASRVLSEGMAFHGGIYNERSQDGKYDRNQDWWPQAEAVVGFHDAYEHTGNLDFLNAANNCLHFITQKLLDHKNGEWYWSVDSDGNPNIKEDKAGPWKAPYHNSRMCFEMISRLNNQS